MCPRLVREHGREAMYYVVVYSIYLLHVFFHLVNGLQCLRSGLGLLQQCLHQYVVLFVGRDLVQQ